MATFAQMKGSANFIPVYLEILDKYSMVQTWLFERQSALPLL